jgi:type VI protein secretion system component VasF
MSGMYQRALAQQVLEARRQRYLRRQRVLLGVFAASTLVFFLVLVA